MIDYHHDHCRHRHHNHICIMMMIIIVTRNWCTSDHTWCYPRWSNGFASPPFSLKPDSPPTSRRTMCSRYRRQTDKKLKQTKNNYYICRRLESCCQAPTSLRGESRSTLSSPRCLGPGLTSSTSSPRWDFETSMTMRLMATMMIMMMSSLKFIEWTCWQWQWQLEWENPGEAKHSFANVALGQKRPRATCSSAPPCFKGGDDDDDFHKNDDDDDDYDNDKG